MNYIIVKYLKKKIIRRHIKIEFASKIRNIKNKKIRKLIFTGSKRIKVMVKLQISYNFMKMKHQDLYFKI